MGLIHANIELVSSDDKALARKGYISNDEIKRVKVRALVDSGVYMLAINEAVKAQLDFPSVDQQLAELANGQLKTVEIVGPIDVKFENRSTTCRAVVLPGETEVLLGTIPMEDMDVIIDPREQQLKVHPERPYLAKKSLK